MKRIVQIKRSRFFNSECNQLILLTQSSFPSLVRLTMETTVTAPRALYKGVGNTVALEKQGKANDFQLYETLKNAKDQKTNYLM